MTYKLLAAWVCGVLGAALAQSPAATHLQCPAPSSTAMKFSILSRRNSSGHWTSEVVIGHSAAQADGNVGPWVVDVEQSTRQCSQGMETVLITAVVTAPPQVGLPGYVLIPGHGYYRVHKIPATWQQARQACVDEGAQLLVINSNAEATAVRDSLIRDLVIQGTSDNSFLHVGFHDMFDEGNFVTVLGEPLSSTGFTTWRRGEPNDNGDEDCGSIHVSVTLNDVSCSKRLYFICEQRQ